MNNNGVNGPVAVQLLVHITNGTQDGIATLGLRMGHYPTPQEIAARLEKFSTEDLQKDAPGFRLQTSVEFFDTVCYEKTQQKFAIPAAWLDWKPID